MFLYSAYQIQLIDVRAARISDIAISPTFKQINFYKHHFTNEQIEKIVDQWEYERSHSYKPLDEIDTADWAVERKSLYSAKDFSELSDTFIDQINSALYPVVATGIRQNLIELGFVNGKRPGIMTLLEPEKGIVKGYKYHW